MSFEALKKEILVEARRQADQVARDLRAKTESEQQRIVDRAREVDEEVIREAEQEGTRQNRRLRQEAELAGRAKVLAAKEKELTKTQQELVLVLTSSDPKDLLTGLSKLLPKEKGVIVPGELHLKDVRRHVKGHDVSDKTIPNEGGFIFKGASSEINLTTSYLTASLFKKHRARIATLLFS